MGGRKTRTETFFSSARNRAVMKRVVLVDRFDSLLSLYRTYQRKKKHDIVLLALAHSIKYRRVAILL